MPAVSRPLTTRLLGESGIERELNIAATNAKKNRSIQISKPQRNEAPRIQRTISAHTAHTISPEQTPERVDMRAKKETIDNSKKMAERSKSFTFADQNSLDTPQSPESGQDKEGGISLGSIEDLIGSWTNTFRFSIFQPEETKKSFTVETLEYNGNRLVLL